MDEQRKDFQFSFVVEQTNEAEAEELLNVILAWVEAHNLFMGGGCAPYEDYERAEAQLRQLEAENEQAEGTPGLQDP